jgi:putative Holliday junction resolvase
VGHPHHWAARAGPRPADARRLGEAVARTLGIPVEYWDERLTTVAANRVMIEADVSRARRRAVVDQIAACLILQGWLDARQPTAPGDEP